MDFTGLLNKYLPLLKKHWLPLSLGALGMIFFTYGLMGLFVSGKSSPDDVVFEASSANQNAPETRTILVDVEGAVLKPGVYKLPQESRIQDALAAAGGLAGTADRAYLARNFNLATKLTDGAKVYIPIEGETESIKSTTGIKGSAMEGSININSASEGELDSLPGVGHATAQKIITGRPYSSVQELLDKKIVGAKVFGQIKDSVSVY